MGQPGAEDFVPVGLARTQADVEDFPHSPARAAHEPLKPVSGWSGGGASGALGKSGESSMSLAMGSTCSDHASWKAQMHQQVNSARALRRQAQCILRRNFDGDPTASVSATTSASIAAEDRMKQRSLAEKGISKTLVDLMEVVDMATRRITTVIADLQRAAGRKIALQIVADKRLDLRAKRPPSENVQDYLQDALERERDALTGAKDMLGTRMQEGQELLEHLKSASVELTHNRHTLHLDRSGKPYQFLDSIRVLEGEATRFFNETSDVLKTSGEESERLQAKSLNCLRKRVNEMVDYRRTLETEVWETQSTIFETDSALNKVEGLLNNQGNSAQELDDEEEAAPAQRSMSGISSAVVSKLRERIKAAAYSGHTGRQLDVLFGRMSRDGSAWLEEDEFRRALRRTLRIPPSTISDAEISVFVHALDTEKPGSINIGSLVRFLHADINVAVLKQQRAAAIAMLEQLRESKMQLDEELKNKTLAWKIDDTCLRVNTIKGLELDALPAPGRAAPKARDLILAARQRPLPPEKVERLRSKLKVAVWSGSSGQQLEALFGRFDRGGAGQLEEQDLRNALRKTFRIPEKTITNSEIASLCDTLDQEQSGSIGVHELVAFIGPAPEPTRPTVPERTLGGVRGLEPIGQAGRPPATAPAGPRTAAGTTAAVLGPPVARNVDSATR